MGRMIGMETGTRLQRRGGERDGTWDRNRDWDETAETGR